MTKAVWLALILAAAAVGPAASAPWFQHAYGEDRAYFRDWLAVCPDAPEPCRLVATRRDPGSSARFDARVAVIALPDGGHAVEIMERGADAAQVTTVAVEIDGVPVPLAPGDWQAGGLAVPGQSGDTLTVTAPEAVGRLVAAMRKGRVMSVTLEQPGLRRASDYSLMGVTAGSDAIAARVSKGRS